MKKLLGLTIAFMLFIGMSGIGTWAYFSDTESVTGNVLTAGTLDLKTDDVDGVTETLLATSMKPGDTVGPETITLKNSSWCQPRPPGCPLALSRHPGKPRMPLL